MFNDNSAPTQIADHKSAELEKAPGSRIAGKFSVSTCNLRRLSAQ
jgi:hypothetical protein